MFTFKESEGCDTGQDKDPSMRANNAAETPEGKHWLVDESSGMAYSYNRKGVCVPIPVECLMGINGCGGIHEDIHGVEALNRADMLLGP